jgi:Ca2+-binding RTX toxin-like protein
MTNRIVEENARTDGIAPRSYWDVPHSTAIEGFATDISVNAGETVDFKINVNGGAGTDYKIEIFRLGFYGGNGAREVAELTNLNAVDQALPLYDEDRGLVDAGNWVVTDSWEVPEDALSGVYLARVQRLDAGGNPIPGQANQIPFIVRNDGVAADIVLQTSDTTWHAYNGWHGGLGSSNPGGPNFYGDNAGLVDHDPIPNSGSFAQDRAYAVSYNRPFITRDGTSPASGAQDYLFGADYAAIHWLEQNGYDVTYISGVDTDRLGTSWFKDGDGELLRKAYISVGHDEYWSGDQRINVEDARDSGVNLLFWSGNEVYWKTRWEESISADGTAYRTLVCYKETWANGDPNAGPEDYNNIDPSNVWTGTWRDTRFHESVDAEGNLIAGGRFYVEGGGASATEPTLSGLRSTCNCAENSLTGTLFGPDGTGERASIDVPSEYGSLRVWRNTSIATEGDDLDISNGILGYEWNVVPDDELRPEGLIKLSSTTRFWSSILTDQGNRVSPGTAEHTLSLYRAESGALVFGAGTVFWSWGLSDEHDSSPYGGNIENTDIKQFTVNMFADMGIQPGVVDAILASQGLVRAEASTDFTPATTTMNDIADSIPALQTIVISGTAADPNGTHHTGDDGQVAAVEVSLDGGATWRPAEGTTSWSFTWRPTVQGTYTIQARAIDDSLNMTGLTVAEDTVEVTAPIPPDTFSLFELTAPTNEASFNDFQPVELGMTFEVSEAGSVTQLRYWRAVADAGDTDVREGHLWRVADGLLLGTVTFTSNPDESGWQIADLATPVAIAAGQRYVVSYRTENNYVSTNDFFDPANEVTFDGVDDDAFTDFFGVISAPQSTNTAATPAPGVNGVFNYGAALVMPTTTFRASNYWVDITFDPVDGPNAPPSFTSGDFTVAENTLLAGTVTATDPDGDALGYEITGGVDADLFTIDPNTGALSFVDNPDFELPADDGGDNVYDLTISVTDFIAPPVEQTITVTVTDVTEGPISTLFGPEEVPATIVTSDSTDYELGVKLQANTAGEVLSLRYYRGAADADDTDTRTLNLWEIDGDLLASVVVVSNPGETGWQVGDLTTPITLLADTLYVVSYGTTQNYAFTAEYFASGHTGPDGVLSAPSSPLGLANGNGVFANGAPGSFPTQSFNASNYWVDVLFEAELPNADPDITSPAAFTAPENQTLAGTVTATDADLDPLTFSISGGEDAALFEIDSISGALSFLAAPDFEAPPDDGATEGYQVEVLVEDGAGGSDSQLITVTLGDVNEAPTALDLSATSIAENSAPNAAVATLSAADPDGAGSGFAGPFTFALVAGEGDADNTAFTIDGDTLRLVDPADFEAQDSYAIRLQVTDAGGETFERTATITVTNLDEEATGGVTFARTGATAATATLTTSNTLSDPDGILGAVSYQWQSFTGVEWQDIAGATAASFTTGPAELGLPIRVVASYMDVFGAKTIASELVAVVGDAAGNTLNGTAVGNLVIGLGGNDSMGGAGGDDTIDGDAGADTLLGGAGADLLRGGIGNDVYIIDALDTLVDTAGTLDRVLASFTYTLLTGFEGLTLLGGDHIDGTGNTAANALMGNGGNNRLEGLAGNDTINGGGGDDTLIGGEGGDLLQGGTGADVFFYGSAAEGGDTIAGYRGLDDTVQVSAGGFGGGLSEGMDLVASGRYAANVGGAATEAFAQFLFDTATKVLFWDEDGTGATDRVLIADLGTARNWAGSEIVVVA